jgi:hypothetical protein
MIVTVTAATPYRLLREERRRDVSKFLKQHPRVYHSVFRDHYNVGRAEMMNYLRGFTSAHDGKIIAAIEELKGDSNRKVILSQVRRRYKPRQRRERRDALPQRMTEGDHASSDLQTLSSPLCESVSYHAPSSLDKTETERHFERMREISSKRRESFINDMNKFMV